MTMNYQRGWYQLAFERELTASITPLAFGKLSLIAVKTAQGMRVFDAHCPHRGAHLGQGGCLQNDVIVCPFHGYRIGLGESASEPLKIREYPSELIGGLLLVNLSDSPPADLPKALTQIAEDYLFVSGFDLTAATTIEMVMENGYDAAHFKAVHGLAKEPVLTTKIGEFGELVASGEFAIPRSSWNAASRDTGPILVNYQARAFSPGLVIAELNGEPPYLYKIITGATPQADHRHCTIRITLALPKALYEHMPVEGFSQALLDASRDGLEKDRLIWNHLNLEITPQWMLRDTVAQAFGEYCRQFG